jgi:hypothetical protein
VAPTATGRCMTRWRPADRRPTRDPGPDGGKAYRHGGVAASAGRLRAVSPRLDKVINESRESRFPAPACGGRRLRSTACNERTIPLVPLASRATASLGRFFGCAKIATSLSPALDSPNRGRRVAPGMPQHQAPFMQLKGFARRCTGSRPRLRQTTTYAPRECPAYKRPDGPGGPRSRPLRLKSSRCC